MSRSQARRFFSVAVLLMPHTLLLFLIIKILQAEASKLSKLMKCKQVIWKGLMFEIDLKNPRYREHVPTRELSTARSHPKLLPAH